MARTPFIGTAIEHTRTGQQVQVCKGSYRDDMPDPAFRFNVMLCEHTEPFPMHRHEYSELAIVLSGTALHKTEFEDYTIAEGDVFVVNSGHAHGFADVDGLKILNIQYDPTQFLSDAHDLQQLMGYQGLFELETREPVSESLRHRLCIDGSNLATVRALGYGLLDEFSGGARGRLTMLRSMFLQIVAHLCRCYEANRVDCPSLAARMARVSAFIRTHYHRPLRVEQLADMAGMSVSNFQRTFKSIFHLTPINLINQVRVDQARYLLANTSMDMAAIAAATGYQSNTFFSTQFKKLSGMTPRDYRRTAGIGAA